MQVIRPRHLAFLDMPGLSIGHGCVIVIACSVLVEIEDRTHLLIGQSRLSTSLSKVYINFMPNGNVAIFAATTLNLELLQLLTGVFRWSHAQFGHPYSVARCYPVYNYQPSLSGGVSPRRGLIISILNPPDLVRSLKSWS